jgi:hypothetical protein
MNKEFELPEFCGEPTADGDIAADWLRQWYEANRESWFDRHWPFGVNRKHGSALADEWMLSFMQQFYRLQKARND